MSACSTERIYINYNIKFCWVLATFLHLRKVLALRKQGARAGLNCDRDETQPFDATPVAKALSTESFGSMDGNRNSKDPCRSLSMEFHAAKTPEVAPGVGRVRVAIS